MLLAQACVSWPIRAETGAKTECFRQRGNTELQYRTIWEYWCENIKICQAILEITQNKTMSPKKWACVSFKWDTGCRNVRPFELRLWEWVRIDQVSHDWIIGFQSVLLLFPLEPLCSHFDLAIESRLAYMHREWDRGREEDGGCYYRGCIDL